MTNMMNETFIARYDSAVSIKKGDVIIMKNRPCKVNEVHISKGHAKHGTAKAIVKGRDVITEKNVEYTFTTSNTVAIPHYIKEEYLLTYLDEDANTITVLDKKNTEHVFNLNCDSTMKNKLYDMYEGDCNDDIGVTIMSCFGEDKILEIRYVVAK